MSLNIEADIEKTRKFYEDRGDQDLTNILLTGESGTGKTSMIRSAPKPVHIDSFDPDGTESIKDIIDFKNVIPDVRYEKEDPFSPSAFRSWKAIFNQRKDSGYFDSIATYFLDSATTWTDSIMNFIQAKDNRSGAVPVWEKDYHPQKIYIRNYLRKIMTLPCHFILTAHLEPQKNKEGNIVARRVMFSGKGAITIPLLFTEIWVTDIKTLKEGREFRVITQKEGLFLARSRLAKNGVLDGIEKSDLRNILKKAGKSYDDKSLFD